ncbi:MAG: ribose-5-phosphate isomerase RpiA [Oligoflexia bacterium]|nr:ribose-5-phosphate isomerase RpiA [Oligoflexia bacterium]
MKELVAKEIAAKVKDGDLIGVGTGSTVDLAIDELAKRIVTEKLQVHALPTSYQTAWRCQQAGIKVVDPHYRGDLSWGFDGADAVDSKLRAIKGKGGAMLKEKIMAVRCRTYYLVIDESKLFSTLEESKCPVPVEVVPEALSLVEQELARIGARSVTLRTGSGKHGPIVTEAANLILDAVFPSFSDKLEAEIKSIVGVVESGLFFGLADYALVAGKAGVKTLQS